MTYNLFTKDKEDSDIVSCKVFLSKVALSGRKSLEIEKTVKYYKLWGVLTRSKVLEVEKYWIIGVRVKMTGL